MWIWNCCFYGTDLPQSLLVFLWFSSHCAMKNVNFVIKVKVLCLLDLHHLASWIKRDQLDVTCFIISLFNAQRVSDINTSILRSLWLICWVISWVVLLWFDVCRCYVVVWLWWCGIRMLAEAVLQPAYEYHIYKYVCMHVCICVHVCIL